MTIKWGKKIPRKFVCRQFGLLLIIALAFPYHLFGQCSKSNAFNCAYVTDGSGGDVFAVDRTGGETTKIQSINGVVLNDIRVATDNMLYVTSNGSVLKLSESGSGKAIHVFDATSAIPGPFTGIRFTPLGDAYVNTPGGVFRIGPDTISGNHLVQITGTTFPAPVRVTDTACSSAGGLAVWPTGDLLIACNTVISGNPVYEVLRCPATNGVASGCTGQTSGIQPLLTTSNPITGLAVDAFARILVASGNTVAQFDCSTGPPCTSPNLPISPITLAMFGTDFPAYIDAAPFPPGFPPSQAGGTPPCNSAAVTVFVSTGDGSGKNGKVWTINTVSPACASQLTVATLALVSSTRPAVGMGISSASRTLTETIPSTGFAAYNDGPFSIEIANGTVSGCNLSLTAQREAAGPLDTILAKAKDGSGNLVPSKAIPFNGEQSWRTTFHGGFPASGCTTPTIDSHIGITASLQYVNPWIALIDDFTGKATLDPIPSVYPGFPLDGVPGDPIKVTNSGLFTTNARIVLVDRGFIVNGRLGYTFVGFESPLVDPGLPSDNVENSGKSFVVKFGLQVNGSPITDAQGFAATTGVSVARLLCDSSAGCPPSQNTQAMLVNAEGNSAMPPSFNYVGGGEFHFNVDTSQPADWCNGIYEVTANSDTFSPHTLQFELVGAPAAPSCF